MILTNLKKKGGQFKKDAVDIRNIVMIVIKHLKMNQILVLDNPQGDDMLLCKPNLFTHSRDEKEINSYLSQGY